MMNFFRKVSISGYFFWAVQILSANAGFCFIPRENMQRNTATTSLGEDFRIAQIKILIPDTIQQKGMEEFSSGPTDAASWGQRNARMLNHRSICTVCCGGKAMAKAVYCVSTKM
jgi:hypothetical protein